MDTTEDFLSYNQPMSFLYRTITSDIFYPIIKLGNKEETLVIFLVTFPFLFTINNKTSRLPQLTLNRIS